MKAKKTILLVGAFLLALPLVMRASSMPKQNTIRKVLVTRNAVTPNDIFKSTHSDFGNKVGAYFELNGTYYQNYELGYVEATISGNSYVARNHTGRNISDTGKLSKVGESEFARLLTRVGEEFATSGNDNFAAPLKNADETKKVITQQFKEVYKNYFYSTDEEFMIGTQSSAVKCWDGYIVQDFSWGDSTFAFGGDRYSMSFIFYNFRMTDDETKGKSFLVRSEEAKYWDENKTSLGYPTTNKMKKEVTLPGESESKTVSFQVFEGGFLYNDPLTGALQYRSGFVYDESSNRFIAEATPYVDSRYGSYQTEFTSSDKTKIVKVYEKGSVVCELKNGEYIYSYRPARIYKSLDEYEWLKVDTFLNDVGDSFATDYEDESTISRKLKQKYKELYNGGKAGQEDESKRFFVGFKESAFHGNWNGVDAQQFILGDSTANPWEGTRTNVAALVYNAETKTVVLLKDNPLYLWNKGGNYNTYGAPLEDSFEVDGDVFQKFENGLLVVLKNNVDTAFLYNGTYEEYVEGKKNYDRPTFGTPTSITTQVTVDDSMFYLAIGVPTVVVIIGVSILMIMMNKKKKNMLKASREE